jgi:hypothetical protein
MNASSGRVRDKFSTTCTSLLIRRKAPGARKVCRWLASFAGQSLLIASPTRPPSYLNTCRRSSHVSSLQPSPSIDSLDSYLDEQGFPLASNRLRHHSNTRIKIPSQNQNGIHSTLSLVRADLFFYLTASHIN